MSVLTSSRILDWTRLRYISVYILIQRVENLSPPLLSSKRIFPTNIWKFVKEARWMTKKSRVNELSVRKKKFFDFIKSPRSFARFAQRLVIYYSFASSIPHRRLNFLNRYRASPRPTPLSTPSPPSFQRFPWYIHTYISKEGGFGMTSPRGGKAREGEEGSRGCAGVNDRPRLEVRGVQCMKPSVIATLLQSDLQG